MLELLASLNMFCMSRRWRIRKEQNKMEKGGETKPFDLLLMGYITKMELWP